MSDLVPVLVPRELVDRVQAVVGVVARFETAASGRTDDYAASEQELASRVSEMEASALALMLGELDETADRITVDGLTYRRLDPPYSETYAGLRAGVRVCRHLYRLTGQRNGPTIVPMELRAGVVEGRYTPAAAVGLAHMNQAMPSREADEVARSLGVLPYSRSAQHRGGTAMGERWASLEAAAASELLEELDIPAEACSVALAVDRVSMPMAEDRDATPEDIRKGVKRPITVQFRMAYAACWTLCDGQGKPLLCVRYAHIPQGGSEAMVSRLRDDLEVLKSKREDLLICTLADGAPEMQNMLDRVVEGHEVAAQLVDFWHLAEYLGTAIASTGRSVQPLLDQFKGYLIEWSSGATAVEKYLFTWQRELAATGPPDAIQQALTYIENHRTRLDYSTAYRLGLPIGSGHVEATAKTIFETRMKRTGCRWRPDGGQALLSLRALATSSPKRWRKAMDTLLATFRATVEPVSNPV